MRFPLLLSAEISQRSRPYSDFQNKTRPDVFPPSGVDQRNAVKRKSRGPSIHSCFIPSRFLRTKHALWWTTSLWKTFLNNSLIQFVFKQCPTVQRGAEFTTSLWEVVQGLFRNPTPDIICFRDIFYLSETRCNSPSWELLPWSCRCTSSKPKGL